MASSPSSSASESLRARAVALGEEGGPSAVRELEQLLKSDALARDRDADVSALLWGAAQP